MSRARDIPILAAVAVVAYAVPSAALDTRTVTVNNPTDPANPYTFEYVVDAATDGLARVTNGDGASAHLDLVIIGDGYEGTDADQARFNAAARLFQDGLFAVAPYTDFRECINVTVINLVSNDSGIDDPDAMSGVNQDTALECSFVSGSMAMTGNGDKITAACSGVEVEYDFIYVIVHDSQDHDGAWADPVGGYAISSDKYTWGTVIAHELAHLVATLADEYRAPSCDVCPGCEPCPTCAHDLAWITYTALFDPIQPNVTTAVDSALVPWAHLMNTGTRPTTIDNVPNSETIGRWEGGFGKCFGIYRPREYCLMDGVTSDDPLLDDFCPVCREQLVEKLTGYCSTAPPP